MEPRELFAVFDKAGDAAFAAEPDGRVCYWSQNAELLLGFTEGQVLSRNCADILAGNDSAGCAICGFDCPVLDLAWNGEAAPAYDLHAATASGERKWINISTILAHVKRGPSPLTVHLMRDIDERRCVEDIAREIMVRVANVSSPQACRTPRQGPIRAPRVNLTPRETEVLRRLSLGRGTDTISAELQISVPTVRNHIQHVLKKLRCHTRLTAVVRAAREGLI